MQVFTSGKDVCIYTVREGRGRRKGLSHRSREDTEVTLFLHCPEWLAVNSCVKWAAPITGMEAVIKMN